LLDYLFRPSLRTLLDPLIIAGMIVLVVLSIMHAAWYLHLGVIILITLRVWDGGSLAFRLLRDEIALLRYGLTVRAHILRLRPHRTVLGEIDGAKLDCAIPVAPRRTYIGSIWLSDGAEAVQLSKSGRINVICLPLTPGTWRVIEALHSEIRYDRMGPITPIPEDN
jgi:hypothetical protein